MTLDPADCFRHRVSLYGQEKKIASLPDAENRGAAVRGGPSHGAPSDGAPATAPPAAAAAERQPAAARRAGPRRADGPRTIVGIGASAGGLEAFQRLFHGMPRDTGMAFVLIQHLDPHHESLTAELLDKQAALPVVQATDGIRVAADCVYVIPPNCYLTIGGGVLHLSEPIERRGLRMPVDFFFRSLAEEQAARSVAIVLTGTGTDGTLGVREIKAAGGIVIVQDPATAQHDGMIRSALATGMVDRVLALDEMPDMLVRYVKHWYLDGDNRPSPPVETRQDSLSTILGLLRTGAKSDFTAYKNGTLRRRIERRMGINHLTTMDEYVELLRGNRDETIALSKDLLIGVTNFFREPEAWGELEQQVIVPLVREHPGGCRFGSGRPAAPRAKSRTRSPWF